MIFDTNINESAVDWSAVQESKYPLGLEGALMHVYENECNYNAIIKSAGLAELKYCTEGNQGELFVNESGAFAGFLTKAKEFFKKVIEKIKSMFKKFFMVINSYAQSDKEFVKKYAADLRRVNMKDFEFKGYKFGTLSASVITTSDCSSVTAAIDKCVTDNDEITFVNVGGEQITANTDEDAISEICDKLRGAVIGKGSMDESEFRSEFKEMLYGDGKDTLENVDIRTQLNIISNTKESVKAAEEAQKNITKKFEDLVKVLDKGTKVFGKDLTKDDSKEVTDKREASVKVCNKAIRAAKSLSSDYTVAFGMLIGAIKDRNRQAKAICVKAINYKPKNEATVSEGGIFDGVVIQ